MKKINFDLKWAQTLDGQLADDDNVSKWITSPRERAETHRVRNSYDGVMIGANTFIRNASRLTVRDFPRKRGATQPVRIIVDARARLGKAISQDVDLYEELYSNVPRPTLILSSQIFDEREGLFSEKFTSDFTSPKFLSELQRAIARGARRMGRSIDSVLTEGGSKLISAFLAREAFSKLFVSIAPIITGGARNRISLSRTLSNRLRADLEDIKILEGDIFLASRRVET